MVWQGEDDSDSDVKKEEGEDDNFFGSSLLHGHIGAPAGSPVVDLEAAAEEAAALQAQVLAEMDAEELKVQLQVRTTS